jgi:hypothetical protein
MGARLDFDGVDFAGVEVLDRFCGVEVLCFAGADVQPLPLACCIPPLGVPFLDLVECLAGVDDFRDLAGDAEREGNSVCAERWRP